MTILRITLIFTLLIVIYFILSIAISNILFFKNSNGSLIHYKDKIIGSKLIGQEFKNPIYFMGRPSQNNYQNNNSGCSNLPYYSSKLINSIEYNFKTYKSVKPDLNLIAESASGLDPDITINGALSQINEVSIYSGINKEKLKEIIEEKAKPRILGLFGEKIVNVLELNITMGKIHARKT